MVRRGERGLRPAVNAALDFAAKRWRGQAQEEDKHNDVRPMVHLFEAKWLMGEGRQAFAKKGYPKVSCGAARGIGPDSELL